MSKNKLPNHQTLPEPEEKPPIWESLPPETKKVLQDILDEQEEGYAPYDQILTFKADSTTTGGTQAQFAGIMFEKAYPQSEFGIDHQGSKLKAISTPPDEPGQGSVFFAFKGVDESEHGTAMNSVNTLLLNLAQASVNQVK